MRSLAIWIQAARPKTLIASISPIAIGSAMAMSDGFFAISTFCFLLLTGLGIQITTNYANDWLDFVKGSDRADRKGPPRVTQQGLVSVREIKKMTLIASAFTFLVSFPLIWEGGFLFAILIACALLLALGYTGGPFPLAYLGLAEFFVLLFFGPVATLCSYFLYSHQFNWEVVLTGLAPGLLSCSLIALNNLRDEEEDRQSRKKTLIVRFGSRFGKWEAIACLLLPFLLPLAICQEHPFILLTLLCFPSALSLAKKIYMKASPMSSPSLLRDPLDYNPLFAKAGKLLAEYTFLFCCSWMIK